MVGCTEWLAGGHGPVLALPASAATLSSPAAASFLCTGQHPFTACASSISVSRLKPGLLLSCSKGEPHKHTGLLREWEKAEGTLVWLWTDITERKSSETFSTWSYGENFKNMGEMRRNKKCFPEWKRNHESSWKVLWVWDSVWIGD